MHEKDHQGLRIIEEHIMEVLFDLQISKNDSERIKMREILDSMGNKIAKAQLTNIVRRKLEPCDYVDYLPYEGVRLTKTGYQIARRIARNHRLAEAMLHQVLDLPFSKLHEEACHLEHGISDEMAEYIYQKLEIKKSPFGMHIPMKDRIEDLIYDDQSILESPVGSLVKLTRIQDHSTEIAKKLVAHNVNDIGLKIRVKNVSKEGVVVEINNNIYEIPLTLSKFLRVKPIPH